MFDLSAISLSTPAIPVFSCDADELDRIFGDSPAPLFRSVRSLGSGDGKAANSAAQCHLRLYVSPESVSCGRAIGALRGVLGDVPPDLLRVEVIDIARDVEAATQDRILFTPTLIFKDGSDRTTRLLGDLSDPSLLLDLLQSAGIARV
jgi:hypothetical protein